MRKLSTLSDGHEGQILPQYPPKPSCPETSLSQPHSQYEWPPLRASAELSPVVLECMSHGGLNEISDCPKIPLNSRCHRWRAAQRIVALHKIVVREVQGNCC